jgi:hypothetical protein
MVQSWKVHKKGEDSKTSKEPEKTQIHIAMLILAFKELQMTE